MQNRFFAWLLILSMALGLTACGQGEVSGTLSGSPEELSWQEQYDMGVRYLSESNYEEAIVAFTAAIEIDPKQAPAYVGRGDAYIGLGEMGKNLAAALEDYEIAIKLDEFFVSAYLALAEVYIRRGGERKCWKFCNWV